MTRDLIRLTTAAHALVALLVERRGDVPGRAAAGFDALTILLDEGVSRTAIAGDAERRVLIGACREHVHAAMRSADAHDKSQAMERLERDFLEFARTLPGYHVAETSDEDRVPPAF